MGNSKAFESKQSFQSEMEETKKSYGLDYKNINTGVICVDRGKMRQGGNVVLN